MVYLDDFICWSKFGAICCLWCYIPKPSWWTHKTFFWNWGKSQTLLSFLYISSLVPIPLFVSEFCNFCSTLSGYWESFRAFHISANYIWAAAWFTDIICSDFHLSTIFILFTSRGYGVSFQEIIDFRLGQHQESFLS